MSKANEVFGPELNHITDNNIRAFVVDVMDTMAPDYFWTCPASMSGKYHPGVSLGKGGLIRHTKLAVWWGLELMQTETWTKDQRDIIIAALLLHDLHKNGINAETKPHNCVYYHGIQLARRIRVVKFLSDVPVPFKLKQVLYGIMDHMGRWSNPCWQGESWYLDNMSRICQTVHLADYCASRRVDAKYKELLLS